MLLNNIGSEKFLILCDDLRILEGLQVPEDIPSERLLISTDSKIAREVRANFRLGAAETTIESWDLGDLVSPHVRIVHVDQKCLEGPPETLHMRAGGVEGPPNGTLILRNSSGELFSVSDWVIGVYFQRENNKAT